MGTDPETPKYKPGDDCPICNVSLFDEVTPLNIEAHVKGVVDCPGPPVADVNGVIIMTQIGPCGWGAVIAGVQYTYTLAPAQSTFSILAGPGFFFLAGPMLICQTEFTNLLVACTGFPTLGIGGTVEIFWGPTIG